MDKDIPEEVLAGKRKKTILIIVISVAVLVLAIWLLRSSFKSSLSVSEITTAVVETGTMENTIRASGEILPEFEQVITSPVNASIKNVNNFSFSLDYRTNRNEEGKNIRNSLSQANNKYGAFINHQPFVKTISEQADEANIHLYKVDSTLTEISIDDALAYIDEIKYKEELPELDFDFAENVNTKIGEEFVKKVRNKINWHLNSSIYQYEEDLKQSQGDIKGDFIEKYTLVKSFKLSKQEGRTTKQKTEQ